jgi:hypothetical protein
MKKKSSLNISLYSEENQSFGSEETSAFKQLKTRKNKKNSVDIFSMATSSSSCSVLKLSETSTEFIKFNQLPCSVSVIDILIATLRFKQFNENLIQMLIPNSLALENIKFFQIKINLFNNFYQVKLVNIIN